VPDTKSIIEALLALASAVSAYIGLRVKGEALAGKLDLERKLTEVRLELERERFKHAEQRAQDKSELLTTVNGSFMRAKVVEALYTDLQRRIQDLEDVN
jgi:hypothetical protein